MDDPSKHPFRTNVRQSYGVVCVRKNSIGEYEAILVKKRYTYAFNEFVYGKYYTDKNFTSAHSNSGRRHIQELLNNMTVDEKIDILSLNFDYIWYRLWIQKSITVDPNLRARFIKEFMYDDGKKLQKLIAHSTNTSANLWEVPKGRKRSSKESDLSCAIREFEEETCINKSQYTLIPNKKLYLNFVDNTINYKITYYVAFMNSKVSPQITFTNQVQISELNAVQWTNKAAAKILGVSTKYQNIVNSAIAIIKSVKNK